MPSFTAAAAPPLEELWDAIENGSLTRVKVFLEANPDAWKTAVTHGNKFQKGDSAMHIAARAHSTEIIDLLISKGAGLEEQNPETGETPLLASLGSTINVPKRLIEIGADKKARDHSGRNALHLAALRGYTITAETLLNADMDINERDRLGRTPLVLALQGGNVSAVLMLLKKNASTIIPDSNGAMPADFSAQKMLAGPEAWIEIDADIRRRSENELLARSITWSKEVAARLKNGAGSDVAAPVKAAFRPRHVQGLDS